MAPSPTPDPDDDQRWLDQLAGRAAFDAPSDTRRQAAWLRAALLAYPPREPEGAVPDPAARAERLIARARRAGVTGSAALPRAHIRLPVWTRLRAWTWAGAAMTVVLVAVVGLRTWPEPAEPAGADSVERGAALQVREVEAPLAERDRLQVALQAAGLNAAPYERLGRPGLDIELPQPLAPHLVQLLRAQGGLVPPDGPALRVEFTARMRPPAASAP